MEKLKRLNELLKIYLDIDLINGNTEVVNAIRNTIEEYCVQRFTLQKLGEKIYGKEIDFEPVCQGEKNEQLSFFVEKGNLKEPEVSADINKIFNKDYSKSDVNVSYENLGYSYERIRYYIETEEGKKEIGQYNEPVVKFTNVLSRVKFLSLIENLTGKDINLPELTYDSWENCARTFDLAGYAQSWREYNYNICKDVKATDGTVICKNLDFTHYKGYKYNYFFPELVCIDLNPLDYLNENLNLSKESCDSLSMFNESFLKDVKSTIPNLFDENKIINYILITIKKEIIQKIEYYIKMLGRDFRENVVFQKSEDGIFRFDSDVTNYIYFGNLTMLCKKYDLPIPDFTDQSLDYFIKEFKDYAESEIIALTPLLEDVREKKKKIEEDNHKKESILKSKKQEILDDKRLKKVEDLDSPLYCVEESVYNSEEYIYIEDYLVYDLVGEMQNLISYLKSFLNGKKELELSNFYNDIKDIETQNNIYLEMDPGYFYGGSREYPYLFITQHELPYKDLKILIDYLNEIKPLLEEIDSDLYEPVSTKNLESKEKYYMNSIYRNKKLINDAEIIVKGFKDIIKQYTNYYNVLNNILIFLQTINCPNIFGEQIIVQLQELLVPFTILSNKEDYKKGCEIIKKFC